MATELCALYIYIYIYNIYVWLLRFHVCHQKLYNAYYMQQLPHSGRSTLRRRSTNTNIQTATSGGSPCSSRILIAHHVGLRRLRVKQTNQTSKQAHQPASKQTIARLANKQASEQCLSSRQLRRAHGPAALAYEPATVNTDVEPPPIASGALK